MSLPGLLIEYLITGVIGVVWIAALFAIHGHFPISIDQISAGHVSLLLPLAYVVGTWIDYVGRELTRSLDEEKGYRGKTAEPLAATASPDGDASTTPRTVHKEEMFARSPEVGKQYELRKSRDRVARGIFTNMVLLTVVGGIAIGFRYPHEVWYWVALGAMLSLLSFRVWQKAVQLSIDYRNDASAALELLRAEAVKQTDS